MQRIASLRSGVNSAIRVLQSQCQRQFSTNSARCLCAPQHSEDGQESDYSQYRWVAVAATAAGIGIGGIVAYKKYKASSPSESGKKEGSAIPVWSEEAKTLAKLPDRIPYLIIGSGTAAFSAARSIRSRDPKAKIVLVGEEPYRPYMRPPLSKELWLTPAADTAESSGKGGPIEQPAFFQWNGRPRSVFFERAQFFCDLDGLPTRENGGIAVGAGLRVVALNPRRQTVVVMPASAPTNSENAPRREISYDRCLIATGGKPNLPSHYDYLLASGKVSVFRNIDDYKKLSETADRLAELGTKPAIVVVGGGYLGCELAFALAWRAQQKKQGFTVYQLTRDRGVLDQVLPAYLSSWAGDRLTEAGVKILSGVDVTGCDNVRDGVKLKLSDGKELSVAHVIVATGIEPNTQLAELAGLEVDEAIGGIAVNSELMARNNLWAAGDVASFYDPRLRARRRIEHHDQAIISGRLAGENMAGAAKVYSQQAMLWSDLGPSVSFEAVGIVDSRLQTYAVFAQPSTEADKKPEEFKRGVIFYLSTPKQGDDSRRLVGMMLWNLPGRLAVARRLLKDQPSLNDIDGGVGKLTEMARIMAINEDDSEIADLPPEKEDEEERSTDEKKEAEKKNEEPPKQ